MTPRPVVACWLLAGLAAAQSPFETETGRKAALDLAVPESPAFTVLDLTPQTVVRPSSGRELATSILNGFDRNGNYQTGLAIDTNPYLLFWGNQFTIRQYRQDRGRRLLARTQISIASTKGATDSDKALRLATGFRLTLWDKGDPRLDRQLDACFAKAPVFVPKPEIPTLPAEALQQIRQANEAARQANAAALAAHADACREEAKKRNWSKPAWVVGYAPSWMGQTGNAKDLRWSGGALWTSLSFPVPSLDQQTHTGTLHFRWRQREFVPDAAGKNQFLQQDSILLGGQFRTGSPNFQLTFEGVYVHARPMALPAVDTLRTSFGASTRISKDVWLTLSFGGETGGTLQGRKDNRVFGLTSFQWGFRSADGN